MINKIDAGEKSERAFILPAKKTDHLPSYPWSSLGLSSQHKASDQKYVRHRRMSTLIVCIVIM